MLLSLAVSLVVGAVAMMFFNTFPVAVVLGSLVGIGTWVSPTAFSEPCLPEDVLHHVAKQLFRFGRFAALD